MNRIHIYSQVGKYTDEKEYKKLADAKEKETHKFVVFDDKSLYCNRCEFKCLKFTALNKHRILKHKDYHCKQCKDKFKTTKDLLMHEADCHGKKRTDETKIQQCETKNIFTMTSKLNFQTKSSTGCDTLLNIKFECSFYYSLGYLLFTFSHSGKKVRYSDY